MVTQPHNKRRATSQPQPQQATLGHSGGGRRPHSSTRTLRPPTGPLHSTLGPATGAGARKRSCHVKRRPCRPSPSSDLSLHRRQCGGAIVGRTQELRGKHRERGGGGGTLHGKEVEEQRRTIRTDGSGLVSGRRQRCGGGMPTRHRPGQDHHALIHCTISYIALPAVYLSTLYLSIYVTSAIWPRFTLTDSEQAFAAPSSAE